MKSNLLSLGLVVSLGALILGACCPSPSEDAGLSNPASVYCEEQGYILEMRTDEDGGTYGVCVFPDGAECDEWAFYRGECGPGEGGGAQSTDEPTSAPAEEAWVNVVEQAGLDGAVEIEILELNVEAATGYVHRLTISDPEIVAQIVAALDVKVQLRPVVPGALCPAWYMLRFRMADGSAQAFGYGCYAGDASVLRGEQDFWQGRDAEPPAWFSDLIREQLAAAPQGTAAVGWYGYVVGLPVGSEYDDYLSLEPEGVEKVGIAGADEALEARIVALRDSEEPAHFWGTLTCDVPDYGGCRLVVTRLRVGTEIAGPEPVEGWDGVVVSNPPLAEYDDHFVLSGDFFVMYGIGSSDPAVAAQLEELRDTMTPVRVSGEITCGVPDVNGCYIDVTRIEVIGEPLTGRGE
jgi:putative hemolysin